MKYNKFGAEYIELSESESEPEIDYDVLLEIFEKEMEPEDSTRQQVAETVIENQKNFKLKFVCFDCGKNYSEKSKLEYHEKIIHGKINKIDYNLKEKV